MSKPLTMTVEQEREYRACCTSGGTEVDPVFAELDATRAALADERKWAEFGAWCFEAFWDEGEPGDLDWCDLQGEAIKVGLLSRRTEAHAAYNCADGCEWDASKPLDECECLFPVCGPRRAKEAANGTA